MSELPNVSIITIIHDLPELCCLIDYHWKNIKYPKEKLEWIILDDSKEDYSNKIPIQDNILHIKLNAKEYLDKISFKKDNDNILLSYYNKLNKLPNGFMRDYAVGLSSHDYIIHLDIDTLYQPKTIERKLNFLKKNKLECVYCKSMLAYDIYNKGIYKIENIKGYESTLFHTREFWKRGGFKWDDIHSEAFSFYYGKGLDRNMENYYDSIKLLHVHNIQNYKPIKIELENIKINIPELISDIKINKHPVDLLLSDIFHNNNINILGLDSKLIDTINNNNWIKKNIKCGKKKEKIIINEIKSEIKEYQVVFLNVKNPIWKIFDKIKFECIIFESSKNIEQMKHILESKNYILLNNIYFNKELLLNN